ncbi:MAG: hypothetical protein A2W84_01505 [Bacteroidetes bacterium GWC2_40_13]|jgi:hypothetical protein|nr:MAG: hypothetical protein A2W84_01505 [Bacteroidetes bacterium GWC2_40_13]
MKTQKGSVNHNGQKYDYEVDENGYIWIQQKLGKTNIGQVRPVNSSDNIENIVHQMLDAGGY